MAENSMSEQEKLLVQLEQRKKEVALRKEIAEAEKAIAEANKARLKAQIPSGEAKPIEGKITTDVKSGYVAELVAYNAMIRRADAIAKVVDNLSLDEKARLMIVDSLDFSGEDVQLLEISNQLNFWDSELKAQDKRIQELLSKIKLFKFAALPAMAAAIPLVTGLLSSAADIIGYFRIDYDIKGREIKLSDIALRSLVAGRIQKYPIYLLAFHRIKSSTVINDFNKCIQERTLLKQEMAELKGQVIEALTEKARASGIDEQEKKQLTAAETVYAQSEALIKAFDEFNKVITSVPEGRNCSPLAGAAIRQYLDQIGITHLLYLTVTSSGGETITGRGLFQWGRVGFLGGCVVTYILADLTGKIITADTLSGSSYVKFNLGQSGLPVFRASE